MRVLWKSFRQDRLLAVATLVAVLLCLAPLAATSIPAFIDLPHHVALSALLWDAAFGQGSARDYYVIDPLPTPYWSIYVFLGIAIRTLGVYLGTKVIVAFCLLLLPLGVMRLLLAFGKNPRLGLFAFLAAWDFNIYFGWLNHVFGVAIAFFALAQLVDADSPRKAMWVWPWGALLAVTHVLPFGYFGLTALLMTLIRPGSRKNAIAIFAVAISVPTLVLVPWLARSLRGGGRADPGFVFDPFAIKLQKFFDYSLGHGHVSPNARTVAMVAFATLVIVPLALLFFDRNRARRAFCLAFIPFITAALLYFTLPMFVARPVEHWGTYPRFATIMLLGLLFLPNAKFTGKQVFALVPALLASAALSFMIFLQFRAFDAALAPFYEIVAQVPRGAKLLPLCYQNTFPMLRAPLGESLHGYIVGHSGGFNPYLFGQATLPIRHKDRTLPAPAAWGRHPSLFSMDKHGQFYDYILVQGQARDPVKQGRFRNKDVTLVLERGIYRLYAVR